MQLDKHTIRIIDVLTIILPGPLFSMVQEHILLFLMFLHCLALGALSQRTCSRPHREREPPPTSPIRPPSPIWLPRLGSPLHFPIPATTIIPSRRKSTGSFPPQPSRKSPSPTGSSSTPTPLLRCQGRYYSCKTRGLSLSLLQREILTIKTRTT